MCFSGAVVLRVAKSWFRIGSLEILAHYGELDLLRLENDIFLNDRRQLKNACICAVKLTYFWSSYKLKSNISINKYF